MIVLQWDWKTELNWDKLNESLKDWSGPIVFNRVDTDSDSYAVIISHGPMNKAEISIIYQNWANQ